MKTRLLVFTLLLLGGCSLLQNRPQVIQTDGGETAESLLAMLETYRALEPEKQKRFLEAVTDEYGRAPTADNRLRVGLLLAQPGHAGANPEKAGDLLQKAIATPWALRPSALDLARTQLRLTSRLLHLERQLGQRSAELAQARNEVKNLEEKIRALTDIEQSVENPATTSDTRDNARNQAQTAAGG